MQAEGDADVFIVKTAVDSAMTHPTVRVGDDTDLLVLLCYHTKADDDDVFCRKHGLDCSPACGQCRGTACTNISDVLGDSDDEEDERLKQSLARKMLLVRAKLILS